MKSVEGWRLTWKQVGFRWQLTWSVLALLVSIVVVRVLLEYLEGRNGVVLADPILGLFRPADVHWITWTLTYSGILFGLATVALRPVMFLVSIRSLIAIVLLRVLCAAIAPLDPPAGFIPLVDPFLQLPIADTVLMRDLLFSWQAAVLSLFIFVAPGRDLKIVFACIAGLTSACLLIQHAQYTISFVTAPCIAYAALGLVRFLTPGVYSLDGSGRRVNGSVVQSQSAGPGSAEKRIAASSFTE